jgi:hypothetical protein
MASDYEEFERAWTQADDHQFRFRVINDATGQVVNITGWLGFWFTVKAGVGDADPGIFQVSLTPNASGSISVIDVSTGLIQIDVKPAATSALDRRRYNLVADIQGKDAGSKIWTLARGQATIFPEVTRAA